MTDVRDQIIIVTGASSGIGAATARLLGERGARVVMTARRIDRLRKLESELTNSFAVVADLHQREDISRLVAATVERFGRIDVLVNNAGQGLHVPIADIDIDDYKAIMDLNVYAPLLLMQAVVPQMRKQGGGTIVNVSSGTTKMTLPGVGAYASTKCALNMLSQVARQEFAADNIVVSLIYPYITETEFRDNMRNRSTASSARWSGMPAGHSAEFVAGHILQCIQTGETEIALRPGTPSAVI
jgi:short-subunit dehydrogenase